MTLCHLSVPLTTNAPLTSGKDSRFTEIINPPLDRLPPTPGKGVGLQATKTPTADEDILDIPTRCSPIEATTSSRGSASGRTTKRKAFWELFGEDSDDGILNNNSWQLQTQNNYNIKFLPNNCGQRSNHYDFGGNYSGLLFSVNQRNSTDVYLALYWKITLCAKMYVNLRTFHVHS